MVLRRTWRPQTQSTRAFVDLWHKRVAAHIRLLRISIYVSLGWIIFCAALTAANWATIGQDVRAHPKDWEELLVACVLMQPVMLWYGWVANSVIVGAIPPERWTQAGRTLERAIEAVRT